MSFTGLLGLVGLKELGVILVVGLVFLGGLVIVRFVLERQRMPPR